MSGRLLLDTDVIIEYLRERPKAVEYVENLESELYVGVKGRREEEALEKFLLAFDVLPVMREIARLGGSYRREYGSSHGTGLADALIAATAKKRGVGLSSFNRKHFPMVSMIVVKDWKRPKLRTAAFTVPRRSAALARYAW